MGDSLCEVRVLFCQCFPFEILIVSSYGSWKLRVSIVVRKHFPHVFSDRYGPLIRYSFFNKRVTFRITWHVSIAVSFCNHSLGMPLRHALVLAVERNGPQIHIKFPRIPHLILARILCGIKTWISFELERVYCCFKVATSIGKDLQEF